MYRDILTLVVRSTLSCPTVALNVTKLIHFRQAVIVITIMPRSVAKMYYVLRLFHVKLRAYKFASLFGLYEIISTS